MKKNYVEEFKPEIRKQVEVHFNTFFKSYTAPEELIERAVEDVLETSAVSDEGYWSDGDISIGCQRAILSFIDDCYC